MSFSLSGKDSSVVYPIFTKPGNEARSYMYKPPDRFSGPDKRRIILAATLRSGLDLEGRKFEAEMSLGSSESVKRCDFSISVRGCRS